MTNTLWFTFCCHENNKNGWKIEGWCNPSCCHRKKKRNSYSIVGKPHHVATAPLLLLTFEAHYHHHHQNVIFFSSSCLVGKCCQEMEERVARTVVTIATTHNLYLFNSDQTTTTFKLQHQNQVGQVMQLLIFSGEYQHHHIVIAAPPCWPGPDTGKGKWRLHQGLKKMREWKNEIYSYYGSTKQAF